jgi:uncharacterized membrane protein
MRDVDNQIVLGTFIAAFVYCLLVLRVESALLSLGVLIYFIHHVSASIQVTRVMTVVSHDLLSAIDRLFPEMLGQGTSEPQKRHDAAFPEGVGREAKPVRAMQSGYLQAIDGDALMQLATAHDLILHVKHRPGHFVV